MNKKITKTQKNTITLLIVLVTLLFFVSYWQNKILDKTDNLVLDKKKYAEEMINDKTPKQIAENTAFVEQSVNFFDELYIDADNVVAFINFLEELTNSLGIELNIQSINSSAESESTIESLGYETIDLSLSVRGSWSKVNDFIVMLENLPYHLRSNELRMNASREEEEEVWTANIRFVGIAK